MFFFIRFYVREYDLISSKGSSKLCTDCVYYKDNFNINESLRLDFQTKTA